MDTHTATEIAYKNGYAKAVEDIFSEIEQVIGEKYERYVFDNRDIEGVRQDAIIEFADCMQKHFAELKKKYIPDDCRKCKHFVGCECFDGKTCDIYDRGATSST